MNSLFLQALFKCVLLSLSIAKHGVHYLRCALASYRNIRYGYALAAVLWLWGSWAVAQPSLTKKRKALQEQRITLLKRIRQIQKILSQTATRKKASLGHLMAITQQIGANERLVKTIQQETHVISEEIVQKRRKITTLARERTQLQEEYATMVYLGSKAMHQIHTLMFVFSADSFHKLVQRVRYVRQYTQIREKHFREMHQIVAVLQTQRAALQKRQGAKKKLLHTQQAEQRRLKQLKQRQSRLLSHLRQHHAKLQRELRQRNKAVKRLDRLAQGIIKQVEAQNAASTTSKPPPTPSSPPQADLPSTTTVLPKDAPRSAPSSGSPPGIPQKPPPPKKRSATPKKRLSKKFRQRKGKLPWPVKEGFISSKFGISTHPVFRQVVVENLGIDIQTRAGATVHALFEGVVKTIAFVPGMNRVVIIQHGDYHSVYARLKHTTVKAGQHVTAHMPIGTMDTHAQEPPELQLQIWHGTTKVNPAKWLKSRP